MNKVKVIAYVIILLMSVAITQDTLKLKLIWDANTDGITDEYWVYKSIGNFEDFIQISTVLHDSTLIEGDTLFYIDNNNIQPNLLYAYYLRAATKDSVYSDPSDTVWTIIDSAQSLVQPNLYLSGANRVELYPNPTNDEIHFVLTTKKISNVEIHIFNSLGQEIYYKKFNKIFGRHHLHIYPNLSSGMYFCMIKMNNKVFSEKLIIVR